MANPYKTLGVPPTASQEEIRAAFRRLARMYHPDVNRSPTAHDDFLRIAEAYRILSDPRLRALYDRGALIDLDEYRRRKLREELIERRIDEIVDDLLRKDAEETRARQITVTTVVALFFSTFLAALVRPPIFESLSWIGWVIWLALVGLGIRDLISNIRFSLNYYTFDEDSTISLMDPYQELRKPFTRAEAWMFLIGGFIGSLALGLLIRSLLGESHFLGDGNLLLCLVMFPPTFVFLVGRARRCGIFETKRISVE